MRKGKSPVSNAMYNIATLTQDEVKKIYKNKDNDINTMGREKARNVREMESYAGEEARRKKHIRRY